MLKNILVEKSEKYFLTNRTEGITVLVLSLKIKIFEIKNYRETDRYDSQNCRNRRVCAGNSREQ